MHKNADNRRSTPQQKEAVRKAIKAYYESLTPEQRVAKATKASRRAFATMTPEKEILWRKRNSASTKKQWDRLTPEERKQVTKNIRAGMEREALKRQQQREQERKEDDQYSDPL